MNCQRQVDELKGKINVLNAQKEKAIKELTNILDVVRNEKDTQIGFLQTAQTKLTNQLQT